MPKLDSSVPFSLEKLRKRYRCSHGVLMGWLSSNVGKDHHDKVCSVLAMMEHAGYKKKQSYLTPKQWSIACDHLDPYLKPDTLTQ